MAKRIEFTKKDTLDILKIAQDHLQQYVAYSEAMREIGRGMSLSSEYSDTFCKVMLANAITNLEKGS